MQGDPERDEMILQDKLNSVEQQRRGHLHQNARGILDDGELDEMLAGLEEQRQALRRERDKLRGQGGRIRALEGIRLNALETMRAGYSGDLLRDAFADVPDAPVDEIQGRMMEMVREKRRERVLDAYTPEQRRERYRQLGISVTAQPDGGIQIDGVCLPEDASRSRAPALSAR